MVTLSLNLRSWSSQLSTRMRVLLVLLAGLSISAIAAGVLFRHRRRRYRAVSTFRSITRQETFKSPVQNPSFQFSRSGSFGEPSDGWVTSDGDYQQHSQAIPVEQERSLLGVEQSRLSGRAGSEVFFSLSQNMSTALSENYFDAPGISPLPLEDDYLQSDSDDSFHSTIETPDDDDEGALTKHRMYLAALGVVDEGGVPCRMLRTAMLKCTGDRDFLAKLHCVRQAFNKLLSSQSNRQFVVDTGRRLMLSMLENAGQETDQFSQSYDDILEYIQTEGNWEQAEKELKSRRVACMNVYDIALDFMLMDAFDDMERPPSALQSVISNGWISNSIKRSLLNTAVWSILKAKKSLLKDKNGFMRKFYVLSETLTPTLAWGFLGGDPNLNSVCVKFKASIMDFLQGIFSLEKVRYASVNSLADDIMRLAKRTAHTLSDI